MLTSQGCLCGAMFSSALESEKTAARLCCRSERLRSVVEKRKQCSDARAAKMGGEPREVLWRTCWQDFDGVVRAHWDGSWKIPGALPDSPFKNSSSYG